MYRGGCGDILGSSREEEEKRHHRGEKLVIGRKYATNWDAFWKLMKGKRTKWGARSIKKIPTKARGRGSHGNRSPPKKKNARD